MSQRSPYARKEKSGSSRAFIWLLLILVIGSGVFIVRDYMSPARLDPFASDQLLGDGQAGMGTPASEPIGQP